MSQAVKRGVVILIALLVISGGVAVFTLVQKQSLEQQNQNLQSQLTDVQKEKEDRQTKVKKYDADLKQFSDRLAQKDKEKDQVQRTYDDLKSKTDELSSQVSQASQERDDWKNRMETIRRERDDLMTKLQNRPEKIVYKEREEPQPASTPEQPAPAVTAPQGEEYWARVLKEKAGLQIEIEKARADVSQSALQMTELKKQNSDLQIEIKKLTDDKEDIERKIKYGEDLANNLSVELARSKNDQKFVNDRAEKFKSENLELQNQVKQLSSTKVALERTIARMTDDKNGIQKKLTETESVIQGRIDEIWQIKQNLDKKIGDLPVKNSPGEVELPPIIVNANGQGDGGHAAKAQGGIISINDANNFVIADLGEGDGSQVGRVLKVYRGNAEIATLEVIQVRKDISAADIKQKSTKLKVGDIVRFAQ